MMKLKSFIGKLCLIFGVILSAPATADIVVLVHGYHSGAYTWEHSGVSTILAENGWPRAGLYSSAGPGVRLLPAVTDQGSNVVYSIDLPSEAPVAIQATLLTDALLDIRRRYPQESITLVGHSAGAIVARAVLVRGLVDGIDRLVSIAAPNLGTERTVQALNAADVPWPFSYVADFFAGEGYHTVKRSRHLLIDLLPASPGTYLGWLNAQPHPDIEYIAIVRGQNLMMTGDWMVPGMSQDLNNVYAIAGKAEVITVPSTHELSPIDGATLASVLNR